MADAPKRLLRTLISVLSASLVVGGFALTVPAEAATTATGDPSYNVVDRPSAGVTADALPTVQIDGVVWDTAIAGNTVFAGGQFTNARPAGAAAGTNLSPRSNLLSFDLRTGVLNANFKPVVDGRIRAMAVSPDKSTVYIVGSFTHVNGQTRNRVAAFNTVDGSLTSFAPNVSNDVFSITVSNSAVYLGGWFAAVNGVSRSRIAAVSPTTGATLAWAPVADSTVQAMTLTPDKTRLIVGGLFANLNGSPAPGLGSLDASTGVLYPFAANTVIQDYGSSSAITSLKADATNVYGTAYWYGGVGNFEGMFSADPNTGAIKSMADCHGDTYDSAPIGDIVYTVSHHHDCSNINGFPDTNPRNRWQRANAFTVDARTTVGPNTAGGYGDFRGQPAPSIINWFPDVTAGSYTGQYQGGWTTEATSDYVVEGGEFPLVNNKGQQGLVRFAIPSIATNKQGPRVSAADSAPALRGISGSSVRVSWPSNWDRDNISLTYKLYRADRPSTPIFTGDKIAEFWNRPTQVFTDTGLTPNTSYGYWVTATDADGNTLKSATSSITTGTNVVDNSPYAQAVAADGAEHYWRLNDPAGSSSAIDWAGTNDLMTGSGVGFGAAGAIGNSPDTAATFDGTSAGGAGQTTAEPGPSTFTAEAWIKTTTTSGGKILGFGDAQSGTSTSYDRHVYMDDAGHLTFGVYPGAVRAVTTGGAYNDGAWHHVVAALSSAGQQLYVDGLLEASDAGTTSAQSYSGYWRVGGDNLGGWPNAGSSQSFAGTVDDVAIYPSALSAATIRQHYTASGRTVNLPPEPADAYGKQVYDDSPSLYWRLGESAGATTVADSSQSRSPGNVFNGVTFGASSDVAPGTAASFNGTDGTISSDRSYTSPATYSEEVWFNTTTTDGGKLIGFGDQRSGLSSNYDRHVYMENSGQLTFGVWTGQASTITSPQSYNDGAWHQMVATQDGTDGMKLYVDGALVGTNPQTQAQPYSGFWRVGGDTSWGGNSPFFRGKLDEAAVYPTALSLAQVRAHYQASGASTNASPVAAFTSSCTDRDCYLDGSTSSDPDGTVSAWTWDFGDGAAAGSGATTPHTYATDGTYTVKLTVTDDRGAKDTVSHQVVVKSNAKPVAAFTSACTELVCGFDASTSSDADGTVASYAWSFGDGSTGSGAKPSHTYAAGTFNVRLTVTDDQGATDTVTHPVTVAAANTSPVASFTATTTGLSATFDSSASSDPDGTIASRAWTFGDGATASTVSPAHTYPAAGSYDVTLTVTDNQGGTNQITKTVTVTAAANQKPVAGLATSVSGLTLSVDGSSSSDADGSIAAYGWNYGDGATGTGRTDSHAYAAAGTYTVTLTVTDDKGATDTATKSVTVTAPPTNQKPVAGLATSVSGLTLSVDGSSSSDADGSIAAYGWNYGDGATGTGRTDSHAYAAAGTYTVTLTVTDDKGATDTATKSVTVTAPPAANVVARDDFGRTGSRWGQADQGGSWTDSGSKYFSTAGGQGLIASTSGAGPTASLNAVSTLDASTTADVSLDKVPTGGGYYLTLSARRQGTSEYRLKTWFKADGTVYLITTKQVGGTVTTLRTVKVSGLTYQAGNVVKLRFDVSGTGTATLSGKAWAASAVEPAAPQVTSTDTTSALQSAGAVAIAGYLSGSATNGPITVAVDHYLVTSG